MQPSSQPVLVSVDLPRPGEQLGSYVILRQVGHGGMAVVYEARHRVIGRRVAIKMLLPHHAAQVELSQRFQREGEAAARLDHPNAVAVLDGGKDARGTPYLVLEYLEGEDLGQVLLREGKITLEETVDLLLPMIAAIAAAHDLGIVHRDLKPENLFLARRHAQLVPKVLDFGISKLNENESMKLTRAETLLGTPHYMSPEQAQGADYADARTDQFAIGVMLYECVTGTCPFEGDSLFAVLTAIVSGVMKPPSELVPGLDPVFEAIVLRALSKEPSARYANLRELGVALLPLASPRVRLAYADELGASASDFGRSYERKLEELRGAPRETLVMPAPTALEPEHTDQRVTVVVESTALALYRHSEIEAPVQATPSLPPPAMTASWRAPLMIGAALVLAALAGVVAASFRDAEPKPTSIAGSAELPSAPQRALAEPPRESQQPED